MYSRSVSFMLWAVAFILLPGLAPAQQAFKPVTADSVPATSRTTINRFWVDRAPVKGSVNYRPQPLEAWYNAPANEWEAALPLGNGRLGAMVFGGVADERIQLNQSSLWNGYPVNADNSKALDSLPAIRKLLFRGENTEAKRVAERTMLGTPKGVKPYQSLGELWMEAPGLNGAADYSRSLDLTEAIARVSYIANGVQYNREVFVSAPDNVIVIRFTAGKAAAIQLAMTLKRQEHAGCTAMPGDHRSIVMKGQIDCKDQDGIQRGLHFAATVTALNEGGSVSNEGGVLRIVDADAVTLLVTGATSYPGLQQLARLLRKSIKEKAAPVAQEAQLPDPVQTCIATLHRAVAAGYAALKKAHITDYRSYFNRVSLELPSSPVATVSLPMNERLLAFKKNGNDPELAALYFQFGRYLLISSSRPGHMPANLQGLWAWQLSPPWNADFHTNINVQMNYWPAETTNLSETHMPLFDLMDVMAVTGNRTARATYGAGGWVVHHLTDAWGRTAPADGPIGIWPMGAAWLARHPWEHYAFTGDKHFLAHRAWPLMKGAARFVMDFLVEAPLGTPFPGYLVTAPSVSPENSFRMQPGGPVHEFTYAAAMDMEIIRDLLQNCIRASEVLDREPGFRKQCAQTLRRLIPLQISPSGRIQEWVSDYEETSKEHRHVSHLYALYPAGDISPVSTPALAEAARKTLAVRGDAGTGWSLAWKIDFWARLHDGDHAHLLLSNLLKNNTLPNLFDTHPPFQIDGNFGATAAIAELLLQSHVNDGKGGWEIELLPALPAAWSSGTVKGLRARGGITVGIHWQDGKVVNATFLCDRNTIITVRTGNTLKQLNLPKGKTVTL